MEIKLLKLNFYKMVLSSKGFLEKCNIKDDTRNEGEFKRVGSHSICPRNSKVTTTEGFVKID